MASAEQQPESLNIQLLVDSIPGLIHTATPNGYLDYFNKPWLEYLGVTLGEVTGWKWKTFIHPEDVEGIVAKWLASLASGEVFEHETRVRRADGKYRWMFHRKVPLRDANGNIVKWYGSSLDIEDSKRAEALLSAEKLLLEMIATDVTLERILNVLCLFIEEQRSGTLASVLLLNPDGVYLCFAAGPGIPNEWKQQMEKMPIGPCAGSCGTAAYTGSPVIVSDIATDPLWEVPEYRASALKHGLRASWSSPVLSSKGKVLGTFCMYYREPRSPEAQDLELIKSATHLVGVAIERDRAKQALRRIEAYLTEAQRLSHTGSFGWGPDTGEIVWSDETYRIFEYDPAEKPTIGMVLQRTHPQDRALMQQVIENVSNSGTDFAHECRLQLPDGRVKHIHAIAHVAQSAPGNREIVGAVTNITERKGAEEQLRRNAEELQRSEFYLAEGQRLAHIGSWAFDSDGFYYWSPELFRMHGLDPAGEPPSVQEYLDRVYPDDRESMADLIKRILAEDSPFDAIKRIERPNGEVRYIRCVGVPLVDNQNLKKYVGSAMDVTEHENLTLELRRREAYLAEAQRLSQTGSWAWSPEQDIRYWSEECYRVLSFDPQDGLPGFEEFFQRIHPDDQPGFRELIETAIREKAEWETDYRIVHPEGLVRDIHVVGHPVLSTSGDLIEFVGTVIDVTERKRAEEERRRNEMELRQIVDIVPQLIAVYGPNRERLYANRTALDYLGISLDQWRHKSFGASAHADDSERLKSHADRALSSGADDELELRLRKRDGSYRWFLARLNPLLDEHGQVIRWYFTGTDIDDRKQAEDRLQRENVALREEIDKASMFEEIVGTSPALKAVLSRISRVAPSDSTVLITGETGTGKELVARAIHRRSNSASRAFVSVNCSAIPRDLIASELFGHEKGAFTGATQQRLGRFELANGGTLFLDEVGELPAETQIALLRVLQEHEFERVGGTRPIRANVRVIAATNRDLQAAIGAGSFRNDLFYRLHVFPIEIPPLRERKEDIRLLVEYFIDRYARKAGKNITTVDKKTLRSLESYSWPGNIRELQNIIERSVIVCETENFSVDESWLSQKPPERKAESQLYLSEKVAAQEKEIIEAALRECQGRVFGPAGAAEKLGIARSTLESKIRSLKINKNRFRA